MHYKKEEAIQEILLVARLSDPQVKLTAESLVENIDTLINVKNNSPFYGIISAITHKNFKDMINTAIEKEDDVFIDWCLSIGKASADLHLSFECSKVIESLKNIRRLIKESRVADILKQHIFNVAKALQEEQENGLFDAKKLKEAASRDLNEIKEGKNLKIEEREVYKLLNQPARSSGSSFKK